ncbi:MAG: hypothetical protein MRY63_03010 [Neomegalonema sp.]|nr:hypothetical protein [Neomegalonema sp.]
MFFEWVATIAIGFAGAGVVLILRSLLGSIVPKTLIPIVAGSAMIGFTIWTEYGWYDRTLSALPGKMEVINASATPSPFRPWTYAFPFVERFTAVDQASLRRNDKVPGQVMADIYLIARHSTRARVPVLLDCIGKRRSDITTDMSFSEDGRVVGAQWRQLAADDPLIGAVCND